MSHSECLAAFCVSHCVMCSALWPNNILLAYQLPLITGVHTRNLGKGMSIQELLNDLLKSLVLLSMYCLCLDTCLVTDGSLFEEVMTCQSYYKCNNKID